MCIFHDDSNQALLLTLLRFLKASKCESTFSLCSIPRTGVGPFVKAEGKNVFCFDKYVKEHSKKGVCFSSADSLAINKRGIFFVEFKSANDLTKYNNKFCDFFRESDLAYKMTESFLFLENSIFHDPFFSLSNNERFCMDDAKIEFVIVVSHQLDPLLAYQTAADNLRGENPLPPCLSKFGTRDTENVRLLYDRVHVFDNVFFDNNFSQKFNWDPKL